MKQSTSQWLILSGYAALVALNQFMWINFATISNTITSVYHISSFDVALLAIIFPLLYIPVSIPSGIFIDKKGYKLSVIVGASFMVLFGFVRAAFMSYAMLLIGQIGIAIAQPFLNNSLSKLATTEFIPDQSTLAIGVGTLAIFVGVAFGLITPPILIQYLSVQNMLVITELVTIGIFLYFLRTLVTSKAREMKTPSKIHFLRLLKIRDLAVILFIAFVGMGAFNGILTWIDSILYHFHFTELQAGMIGLLIVLSGIAGSYVIPLKAAQLKRRKVFIVISFIFAIPIFFTYVFVSNFILLMMFSAVLGFFMLGSFPLIIDWGTVLSGPKLGGSATSLIWIFGQIGGFSIPLIMGVLGPLSPHDSYLYAFILLALSFLVVFIWVLKMKDIFY